MAALIAPLRVFGGGGILLNVANMLCSCCFGCLLRGTAVCFLLQIHLGLTTQQHKELFFTQKCAKDSRMVYSCWSEVFSASN